MSAHTISVTNASAEASKGIPSPAVKPSKWKGLLLVAAALGLAGLGSGCVAYPGGFTASYYEPDYSSYYGDYGYGGEPFGGYGGFYGGDIIVGGVHHHGYYGGHHIGHDFHGGGGGGHGGWHGGGGHGGGGGGHHH